MIGWIWTGAGQYNVHLWSQIQISTEEADLSFQLSHKSGKNGNLANQEKQNERNRVYRCWPYLQGVVSAHIKIELTHYKMMADFDIFISMSCVQWTMICLFLVFENCTFFCFCGVCLWVCFCFSLCNCWNCFIFSSLLYYVLLKILHSKSHKTHAVHYVLLDKLFEVLLQSSKQWSHVSLHPKCKNKHCFLNFSENSFGFTVFGLGYVSQNHISKANLGDLVWWSSCKTQKVQRLVCTAGLQIYLCDCTMKCVVTFFYPQDHAMLDIGAERVPPLPGHWMDSQVPCVHLVTTAPQVPHLSSPNKQSPTVAAVLMMQVSEIHITFFCNTVLMQLAF